MTVGEALTEARHQAGLTVDELSQRTRIRETVIRSIERDDFDACGGDLYVRGYVRAIAGAVGIDAQPLIREFDMTRARGVPTPGNSAPDATALDLTPVPAQEPDPTALDRRTAGPVPADATMLDLPQVPAADPAETRFDLPLVTDDDPSAASLNPVLPEDPAATRYDLPPVTDPLAEPSPLPGADLMAAGYELPPADGAARAASSPPWPAAPWSAPSRPARPWPDATVTGAMQGPPGSPRHGRKHFPALAAVLIALVLAGAGLLVAHLSSGGTATGRLAAAAKLHSSSVAKAPSVAKSAKAKRTAKPTAKAASPVVSLPIAAAEAFGPDGLADGDNPQLASNAIARDASQPWSTEWYATPDFGNLKPGTGLLLDLGHAVTITSVRVNLSRFQGANLELKTGDGTAPEDLNTAATMTNTGGVLRVSLQKPATARYLLIWFSLLPPNGQGQFQESISAVEVNGRA